MTKKQLANLNAGDVIKSTLTHMAYTVLANYGDHAIAVDVAHVCHADEWDLLYTATLTPVPPSPRRRATKKG